jgi:hypothetical protein
VYNIISSWRLLNRDDTREILRHRILYHHCIRNTIRMRALHLNNDLLACCSIIYTDVYSNTSILFSKAGDLLFFTLYYPSYIFKFINVHLNDVWILYKNKISFKSQFKVEFYSNVNSLLCYCWRKLFYVTLRRWYHYLS